MIGIIYFYPIKNTMASPVLIEELKKLINDRKLCALEYLDSVKEQYLLYCVDPVDFAKDFPDLENRADYLSYSVIDTDRWNKLISEIDSANVISQLAEADNMAPELARISYRFVESRLFPHYNLDAKYNGDANSAINVSNVNQSITNIQPPTQTEIAPSDVVSSTQPNLNQLTPEQQGQLIGLLARGSMFAQALAALPPLLAANAIQNRLQSNDTSDNTIKFSNQQYSEIPIEPLDSLPTQRPIEVYGGKKRRLNRRKKEKQ